MTSDGPTVTDRKVQAAHLHTERERERKREREKDRERERERKLKNDKQHNTRKSFMAVINM